MDIWVTSHFGMSCRFQDTFVIEVELHRSGSMGSQRTQICPSSVFKVSPSCWFNVNQAGSPLHPLSTVIQVRQGRCWDHLQVVAHLLLHALRLRPGNVFTTEDVQETDPSWGILPAPTVMLCLGSARKTNCTLVTPHPGNEWEPLKEGVKPFPLEDLLRREINLAWL